MPDPLPADARAVTHRTVSRRAVVLGAGAAGAGALVVGCSTVETPAATGQTADNPASTPVGPASEVPVGSARIFEAVGVVVTQATAGSFAAFSTTCPHQGCAVTAVDGPTIICPCHDSRFALDGSVTSGPAPTGLEPRPIAVDGDRITLA